MDDAIKRIEEYEAMLLKGVSAMELDAFISTAHKVIHNYAQLEQ